MHRSQAQPESFVTEYRPVAGFPGYVVNAAAVVWSVGRTVRTRGGATRTTPAKPLKPDDKNRVALRRDGKTFKINVDQLALQQFPPKRHCTLYHRIVLQCRWCGHEFGDLITVHCQDCPTMWPDLFRCPYCTTAVTRLPEHFPTNPLRVERGPMRNTKTLTADWRLLYHESAGLAIGLLPHDQAADALIIPVDSALLRKLGRAMLDHAGVPVSELPTYPVRAEDCL
jgi:hypothetical protein